MCQKMSQTLHGMVEAAALRFPHNVAVVFDDGEGVVRRTYHQLQQDLTQVTCVRWAVIQSFHDYNISLYEEELQDSSCQRMLDVEEFARYSLKMKQVYEGLFANGCVIGIACPPADMLPSLLLGVLSAGAAFHPIDRHGGRYSVHGIKLLAVQYVLIDADSLQEFADFLGTEDIHISPVPSTFLLEHGYILIKLTYLQDFDPPVGCAAPMKEGEIIAYCITTSGTTGAPKVVRVPHSCIIPNITHLRDIFEVTENDMLFLASPLTFDPSVVEIFLTLTSGASILITPQLFKMVPRKFVQVTTVRHHVTILQVTPTLISNINLELLQSSLLSDSSKLRILAFGGERCPSLSTLRRWRSAGNQTQLFNLYGTTEVSCWATYHRIDNSEVSTSPSEDSVPLGRPLVGTDLEVWDGTGTSVEEGDGELYIGGTSRVCLIGEEKCVGNGRVMRPTGDWVRCSPEGTLTYLGRTNQQVKRHGMRLNLHTLEQVVNQIDFVTSCAVALHKGRLLVFITCRHGVSSPGMESADIRDRVENHIRKSLPTQYHADSVRCISTLPLTKHGKVDKRELVKQVELFPLDNGPSLTSEDVRKLFEVQWKETFHGDISAEMKDKTFIEMGGDSFRAVRLASIIEGAVGRTLPLLLDLILHQPIRTVCDYVGLCVINPSPETEPGEPVADSPDVHGSVRESGAHNTTAMEDDSDQPRKARQTVGIKRKVPSERGDNSCSKTKLCKVEAEEVAMCVSRGGRVVYYLEGDGSDSSCEMITSLQNHHNITQCCDRPFLSPTRAAVDVRKQSVHDETIRSAGSLCDTCGVDPTHPEENSSLKVTEVWRYNTGKCVDASPLAVVFRDGVNGLIFIGSHSHLFSAISMRTGTPVWERKLGDRIESSACLTPCGKYVVVGCYDHNVYFLNIQHGGIHFKFETGGEVKSSPVADAKSSLVFVGSHDQHLYALSAEKQLCLWRCPLGGGSIFSSPAVSVQPYQVIAASLDGSVIAIHPLSGVRLWQYQCDKPVFSSPLPTPDGVCFGAVDGKVYFLSHQGKLLWTYRTQAPVFSSPSLCNLQQDEGVQNVSAFVIGSHDGHVYCLSSTGELLWRCHTGAVVYATPFVTANRGGHSHTHSSDPHSGVTSMDATTCRAKLRSTSHRDLTSCRNDRLTSVLDDRLTSVSDDRLTSVSCDRLTSVLDDRLTSVSGDRLTSVSGDRLTSVSCDRLTSVSGDRLTSVSDDRLTSVSDDRLTSVSDDRLTSVSCDRPNIVSDDKLTSVSCDRLTDALDKRLTHPSDEGLITASSVQLVRDSDETLPSALEEKLTAVPNQELTSVYALKLKCSSDVRLTSICDKKGTSNINCGNAEGDGLREGLVVVSNTCGCVRVLGSHSAHLYASYHLPGQVFSSPVIVQDLIYTGCRDNHLYCLKLDGVSSLM